jgi:hypothetical protein
MVNEKMALPKQKQTSKPSLGTKIDLLIKELARATLRPLYIEIAISQRAQYPKRYLDPLLVPADPNLAASSDAEDRSWVEVSIIIAC